MPKYKLIIDLATSRVLYFTSEPDELLYTDEHSVQAAFEGDLPQGMSQLNSTNFKYTEQSLRPADSSPSGPVQLLDLNKKSLLDFLQRCVNEKLKLVSDTSAERLTYSEAQAFLADNSRPSRWLELLTVDKDLTLVQMAQNFSRQYEEKIDLLYRVERVRQRWLKSIGSTFDSAQLVLLRSAIQRDFNIGVFSDER